MHFEVLLTLRLPPDSVSTSKRRLRKQQKAFLSEEHVFFVRYQLAAPTLHCNLDLAFIHWQLVGFLQVSGSQTLQVLGSQTLMQMYDSAMLGPPQEA